MITEQTPMHHMPQTQAGSVLTAPDGYEAWQTFFTFCLSEYDALQQRRRAKSAGIDAGSSTTQQAETVAQQ